MNKISSNNWLNGAAAQQIDINDRGLLYGDGFFTTIKVTGNKIHRWPLHMERLSFSAQPLGFKEIDVNLIYRELKQFIEAQAETDGIIRLTLTRGSGPRGYKPPGKAKIQRLMSWTSLDKNWLHSLKKGVRLSVAKTPISTNKHLAGIKHLNRLDQVIAAEQIEEGCFDSIMLANKFIISGSKTNIYFYLNNRWLTPKLKKAGVNGTVRRWLLATQNNVSESKFGLEILKRAEYCLVSNAIIGIIPVTQLADKHFKPFPHLESLQNEYEEVSIIN